MFELKGEARKQIEQDGYFLLKGVLSGGELSRLLARLEELWREEGERAGEENYIEPGARRLANLVNKGDIFRLVFGHPAVLEAVKAVLGPAVRLSMLNARDVPPHADPSMPFHCDTDHSGKPDEKGYYTCTAVWMLDDFTRQNGATRLVPGTHLTHAVPKEVLDDIFAPHPDEIVVEGKAGDVLVFNGHCWHAGGANQTDSRRRAILAHYIRADHPQRLKQKEHVAPEVQARMNPTEREILGLDD
jgi:ectoine hydroxylase-related dioxygenase (phytanoyl-CoA dioxygenase family)